MRMSIRCHHVLIVYNQSGVEGGKNVTTAVRFGGWENVDMGFVEEDVSMGLVFIMDMIMVSGVGDRRSWPLFFR